MKKNLYEMIDMCKNACNEISVLNIGSVAAINKQLKDMMFNDLLQFLTYIALTDSLVSKTEFAVIKKTLQYENISDEALRKKIDDFKCTDAYVTTRPITMKYFVLADAGKKLSINTNKYQNAQILLDVYKLLGQAIIAVHNTEIEPLTKRLTAYTSMLEDFLKEYGVYYVGSKKYVSPSINLSEIVADARKDAKDSKGAGKNTDSKGKVIPKAPEDEEEEVDIDKLLEELNAYVGLTSVKHEVASLVNLIKVQKMREAIGLKSTDVTKHMVFYGNPGTGKTTVARILSKIYRGLGVVQNSNFVEVDRSGLVCGYVGQTAIKTMEVIEQAMGGILFVDEAYALTVDKGNTDFGQEAVDTLLKAMEDHRDELVVIVAGYQKPMEQFIASNPGLKSRFNKYLFFEDYTPQELLEIMDGMCKGKQYILSEEAKKEAFAYFEAKVAAKEENFANAREARNYLEKAITRHATRVVKLEKPDKEMLQTIEKIDLLEDEIESKRPEDINI